MESERCTVYKVDCPRCSKTSVFDIKERVKERLMCGGCRLLLVEPCSCSIHGAFLHRIVLSSGDANMMNPACPECEGTRPLDSLSHYRIDLNKKPHRGIDYRYMCMCGNVYDLNNGLLSSTSREYPEMIPCSEECKGGVYIHQYMCNEEKCSRRFFSTTKMDYKVCQSHIKFRFQYPSQPQPQPQPQQKRLVYNDNDFPALMTSMSLSSKKTERRVPLH